MSKFKERIRRIESIQPHPNAAKLELARISGFQVVLKKDAHQAGDLVALLPEQTIVPSWLLKHLNMWDDTAGKGRLAGPAGNRVHPVELRGQLSMALPVQGSQSPDGTVALSNESHTASFYEGDDVAEFLGCTKYTPEPPAELAGDAFALDLRLAARFDVEDVHNYPEVLTPGEEVVVLEKVHGVFTGIADVTEVDHTEYGRHIVTSKGLADQGLAFIPKPDGECNVYQEAAALLEPGTLRWHELREALNAGTDPIWVLGETYGRRVQDLHYGVDLGFVVFALATGYRYDLKYVDFDVVADVVPRILGLRMPKVLYRGPYDLDVVEAACQGSEQVSGRELHMREGGVIVPAKERKHTLLDTGRVALKCVSSEYRRRSGGTEYR